MIRTILALVVLAAIPPVAPASQATDDLTVRQAYELRMTGHAGDALAILEEITARNPQNGLAYFELARTRHHIMLANPREMDDAIAGVREACERAAVLQPDNVVFTRYRCCVRFLDAYLAIKEDSDAARAKLAELCASYENVLTRRPDCTEALLNLVEIHGTLPASYGSDRAKAERYAARLVELDPVVAAKAWSLLLSRDEDPVAFWERTRAAYPEDTEVLVELGKARLRQGDVEPGVACLESAMAREPGRETLHLDIARHFLLAAWRGEGDRSELVPSAQKHLALYLATEPSLPMKAYALGMRATLAQIAGDDQGAANLQQLAAAADPYYSRATGTPPAELFSGLDQEVSEHRYLFRPY